MNHPIITYINPDLICVDGPFTPTGPRGDYPGYEPPVVTWEPRRNRQDRRPTFAEALAQRCKAQGMCVAELCRKANIDRSAVYTVRNCDRPPSATHRVRMAALVGLDPDAIRWPVRKEAH